METGRIYVAYVAIMFVLNFAIFATPYLASIGSALSGTLYDLFSYTCHQSPSRSFFLFNHQLPVCARDTAIYLAMLIGGLALPFLLDSKSRKIPSLWLLVLTIIPIALDGTTQFLGWRESTNEIRILTGGLIGLVIPFYLVPLLNFFVWRFNKK